MNKIQFEAEIQKVYDNLTKEQFKELLITAYAKFLKQSDKKTQEITLNNNYEELAYDIFNTVLDSKKISFKQFKVLSAFSKIDWISEQPVEYKQF